MYRELGLTVKRTRRKRLERVLRPRPVLTAPNQEWSIDFASDVTAAGRWLRVLSVIDSFTKQSLALEVDSSFLSRRVTRVLSKAMENYGKPQAIRCDNGPEISSRHFLAWAIEETIDVVHIRPGKPTENPYVAYCTSLEHCGKIRFEVARSWSLIPCCFRGGLSSSS